MQRGRLRIYLGAAAGVGTTYAMLSEALRRQARGARVMTTGVVTHGRPLTAARLHQVTGAAQPDDIPLDEVLAAAPDVVLVDDLGAANPPDARHRWRWQDVDELLDAGIDVVATLRVEQIESLGDPVREILGTLPTHVVPDDLLRRADQIEVVDISPEAIRRRIAHGNVFPPDQPSPAETQLFQSDAFARLRALMMFWMADRLATSPDDSRGAREKVVVAVTDSPSTDLVLRRAARLAQRSRAPLLGVHVSPPTTSRPRHARRHVGEPNRHDMDGVARRERVERLGGSYHEIADDDVAGALLSFASSEGATQLVVGTPGGRRWWPFGRTVVDDVLRRAADVDVHVVSLLERNDRPATPASPRGVSRRRQALGAAGGAVLLAALTALFVMTRGDVPVSTALAVYLLAVVAITAVGGAVPGIAAAVASPLLVNWFLIEPYHTLRIDRWQNLLELAVFMSVSAVVAVFVSVSARSASEARRARAEAATLINLTGSATLDLPDRVVEELRTTFDLDGVAVLAVDSDSPMLASAGAAPRSTAEADLVAPLSAGYVVAATGPPLSADDHRVFVAFVAQLARAFEQQRLRAVAAEADALARADELRTAMLRAVSHDLRSPLASIKASVSSLRQPDVDWPADVEDEFLASIETETDRLTAIVTNLLDLSRLEAGVLRPARRSVSLEEVLPTSLPGPDRGGDRVVVSVPGDVPEVIADPALLERVIANLVGNAVAWSGADDPVHVCAHATTTSVQVLVIDHGPGIPADQRAVVVQPFHRLDDSGGGGGLGLGLAIADRLVAAMGGTLVLGDTPGGGLTVTVELPAAPGPEESEPR